MDAYSKFSDDTLQEAELGLLSEFQPGDQKTTCHQCASCRSRSFRWFSFIPWALSLALSVLLLVLEAEHMKNSTATILGFWKDTEFDTVKAEIPAVSKQVRFTAALKFNESHQLYRPIDTSLPQYVGTPTVEIDANWEELIGAIDVFLSEKEAKSMGGTYFEPSSGLYRAEVTVFHNLHCLNMIRQSLFYNREYYYPHRDEKVLVPHLDHCLDNLRESIMCEGDMTFYPMLWSESQKRIVPDFEVVHTCRDYNALRDWALDRDAATEGKWEESAARLHAKLGQ